MSRLGVFYALQQEALQKLWSLPSPERYDYMLEEIEPQLIGTDFGYEMDRAWEGVQYCLGGGVWSEENRVPENIVFAGEFLVNTEEEVITLKSQEEIREIIEFLRTHDLAATLRANFDKIPAEEYTLPKDAQNLEYLIGWSSGLKDFYETALKNDCSVIFTVDL